MNIIVNGENKNINSPPPPTLEKVITSLGYNPKLIVIEYNGKILPPSQWSTQEIKHEDRLEIVTIVGGGS